MFRTYDYECEACGHTFEALQKDTKAQKKCPECDKMRLKRKFPAPALHMRYSPMHPRVGRGRG
jgi:putative FmdB family regulatory protein